MSTRFWLVVPLNAPERAGATAQRIGQPALQQLGFENAVRPRRGEQANVVPDAAPQESSGYGYVPDPAVLKKITHFFTNEEVARKQAKELATLNPKTLWGVFACIGSYETTAPSVIHKIFNQDGELVIQS